MPYWENIKNKEMTRMNLFGAILLLLVVVERRLAPLGSS
jgi:hypothetical protein